MNSKIYIDFDGVILDTWGIIFSQYYNITFKNNIEENIVKKVMKNFGWNKIINNSKVINNGISKINKLKEKYDVIIITKINSKEEMKEKRKFLNNNNIHNIIFVPYEESKSTYVTPQNNYLIDDDLKNLDDWYENGGIPIFFNKDMKNFDSYGLINTRYILINDLNDINIIIQNGGKHNEN